MARSGNAKRQPKKASKKPLATTTKGNKHVAKKKKTNPPRASKDSMRQESYGDCVALNFGNDENDENGMFLSCKTLFILSLTFV